MENYDHQQKASSTRRVEMAFLLLGFCRIRTNRCWFDKSRASGEGRRPELNPAGVANLKARAIIYSYAIGIPCFLSSELQRAEL